MKYAAVLLFLALPAAAQDASAGLNAEEFGAYVTGKTLIWSFGAQHWGTEEYLSGQGVQWATEPGQCLTGQWFEDAGQICFDYDGVETDACWIFRKTETGLTADLQGPNGPLLLSETGQSDKGLPCPGPEVGV